ncbi:MAG: RsmD family RNA methyltransferase [Fibrobacteres bacterium]|nr:RsmD family RNA methyltransferase [Fibrobacterota bacterium]
MAVIIMGGRFKGRKLQTDTRASLIRPTSGKVREAMFSSIGEALAGEAFVDLYAGSGAVGLEALSRGASSAHLVEKHPQSWTLLKANCRAVLGEEADLAIPVKEEARAWCRRMRAEGRTFPYIFADPPFQDDFSGLEEDVLGLLTSGGIAIIQYPTRNPPAWIGRASKLKKYGDSSLAFFP